MMWAPGHKTDWGLMLDGAAGKLKYDVTLTRGSGKSGAMTAILIC